MPRLLWRVVCWVGCSLLVMSAGCLYLRPLFD
jgi:hypothetical protein